MSDPDGLRPICDDAGNIACQRKQDGGKAKPDAKCRNSGPNITCALNDAEKRLLRDAEQMRWEAGEPSWLCYVNPFCSHDHLDYDFETSWCIMIGPLDCVTAAVATKTANAWANRFYLGGNPEDRRLYRKGNKELNGKWNAFQHAMWMAILGANGYDEHDAAHLGAAHELDAYKKRIRENKSSPNIDYGSSESKIDMNNNQQGFRIGVDEAALPHGLGSHGQAMPTLANAVRLAVEGGLLVNGAGYLNISGG